MSIAIDDLSSRKERKPSGSKDLLSEDMSVKKTRLSPIGISINNWQTSICQEEYTHSYNESGEREIYD